MPVRVRAGTFADSHGSHVTVIAAGANQKPGETRLELLARNWGIFRNIIPQLIEANRDGVIVVATNPVDVLTYGTWGISGLPRGRVIGTGTHYEIDPRSVHALIIGEHGDSEVPVWSRATIGGMKLHEFGEAQGRSHDQATLDGIFAQTRDAAQEIIKRKGATYYAVSSGMMRLLEAILRDEQTILPVSCVLRGQYGLGRHERGGVAHCRPMKIVSLELIKVPPSWVWLKIHTDEGITGLGEPYLENHPDSVIAEVLRLEPLLIGEDPRRIEWLWNRMYEGGSGYKGGPVKMSAISGIDMALWDITGKAAGLPVHRLLGGATRDRVLVYRAVGGGRPHVVEPGDPYRAGRRDPVPGDPKPGSPAIDIHNPHPAIARQMLRALAPHRPLFVEEPMPIERVDALAEAVAGSEVPVAAGERWMGKWIFFDALSRGLLAVVQPDLAHAGGITECRKIAAIAEAAYATVALHCPLSPLAFAASVQLDASIPNFLVQEHNEVKGYLRDPFVVGDDGCVEVPNAPGLGVEIDEAGMARIMAKPWSTQRG
ncbi:MAG: hypothetical protein EBT47_07940 [Chloroflexi bacterium]|nr:hypothetical protein [Chloroflexota bacterium]